MRTHRWLMWLGAAIAVLLMMVAWKTESRARRIQTPRYSDGFVSGRSSEWKPFGGTWTVRSGVMENSSGERGAKTVTGSPQWKNYAVEADVQLLGPGDAGLIGRVSRAEEGVDAYRGYYVGLRTRDDSMVLGRSGFRFLSFPTTPVPGGVHPLRWYHLTLLVDGCTITGGAHLLPNGPTVTRTEREEHCDEAGEIGLRSYASGGLWRNVRVSPLTPASTLTGGDSPTVGEPVEIPVPMVGSTNQLDSQADRKSRPPVWTAAVSIADLRWVPDTSRPVHIRGTVVATSPALFVQDPSGGVLVREATNSSVLKMGDEVDVSGRMKVKEHTVSLVDAVTTQLWNGSPLPPVSITDAQAASGSFDSQYVEIDGVVTGHRRVSPDQGLLMLTSDHQTFAATIPNEAMNVLGNIDTQSRVRLRGICLVDPQFTTNAYPFVIALHSKSDIQVLAGAPWWTPAHLLMIGVALTLIAFAVYEVRHRIQRSQLRAIVDERERLAHEMHDTLAQSIAGIGFQLSAVKNRIPEEMPQVGQQLEVALQMVRHIHDEARRNIATLRPESMQDLSLSAGIVSNAERMVNGGQIRIQYEVTGVEREIPLRLKDTLFRISYEALANAVQHSEASCISVHVAYAPAAVRIRIADNGIGLGEANTGGGFGIVGMRKRAKSISASFSVGSAEGGGTVVECAAPLQKMRSWIWRLRDIANVRTEELERG
jgi:signal transduction histidine kinase